MISQRLLARPSSLASAPLAIRPFTTGRPALDLPPRTPSLADITTDGIDGFAARQREFRARTAAAQKAREQQESQSIRRGGSAAPTAGDAIDAAAAAAASSHRHIGLGSLSTNTTEAKAAADESGDDSKSGAKGALTSLIYGTKEGRQMDREIERSFSQVLARGKYVHSIVFHRVRPDKVDEYVALVSRWYPSMASVEENKVNLVGSWRTEVGDCDTFGG